MPASTVYRRRANIRRKRTPVSLLFPLPTKPLLFQAIFWQWILIVLVLAGCGGENVRRINVDVVEVPEDQIYVFCRNGNACYVEGSKTIYTTKAGLYDFEWLRAFGEECAHAAGLHHD